MFCHRYPTGACVNGNVGVRSLRDNVASSLVDDNLIVRSGCDCQPQGGRELGWRGMVNICESLINVVTNDKRKRLGGLSKRPKLLDQKGKWSGIGAYSADIDKVLSRN